jgi:adenine-specific DNA-methyltransferase
VNKSLLEQLPEIVRNGKRRAEQILESLEGKTRVGLQTRELVTPARDSNWKEFAAVKTAGKPGATVRASSAQLRAVSATRGAPHARP